LRRAIGVLSGVLDTGLAASANFAVGLFAVSILTAHELALYSLFFAGWIVAQLLPAQTAYLPARLAVNVLPEVCAPRARLDVRRGWLPVCAAPLLVSAAGLPVASHTDVRDYIYAAVAVAALTAVAPLQDHLRASLHIVQMHTSAALTSAATLAAALLGLLLVALTGIGTGENAAVWVPFGVLVVANAAGILVGLACLSRAPRGQYELPAGGARLGYLGPPLITHSNLYLASVITAAVLGASTLATLEAARVMASPVVVVASGLATYISPTTIRHFVRSQFGRFRRRLVGMAALVVGVGAIYSALLLIFQGPAEHVFGRHADARLGALRAIVTSVDTSSTNAGSVLFVAGRPLAWNVVAAAGSLVALVALVPCLLVVGVFGAPLAQACGSALKSSMGLALAARAKPRTVA
jgi:hypothetical protein